MWLQSGSPRNRGCRAGCLSKGTFSEMPARAKRYEQLWRNHSLLTKPPRAWLTPRRGQRAVPWGSARSRAPGNAQGSSSLEHRHRGWQLTSDGKTRGEKRPQSIHSSCQGLWSWGQAGDSLRPRALPHGPAQVILRWVRWERVAVSFLSALISMVTRGTRDPGLKYTLPPVLPSG